MDYTRLKKDLRGWAEALGFDAIGVTDTDLGKHPEHFERFLAAGRHGRMTWLERNRGPRADPATLVPGTVRIISVRMNYRPPDTEPVRRLGDRTRAYISRYALGRDYHKLMRKRLAKLAKRLDTVAGPAGYRAFTDSAPVLEKAVGEKAGLGWIGKNTLLLSRQAGSWFFLGELFTDLPLPVDAPETNDHCGTCNACLDICPTGALVGPRELDANRCIAYLTIEHPGSIPEALRPLMGNRVFGCDDCQLICPWNKFSQPTREQDFHPRHGLDDASLAALFHWDEATFLARTEGSAIRRAGYERFLRNLAVGLGNAPTIAPVLAALRTRRDDPSALVREHVRWALARHAATEAAAL